MTLNSWAFSSSNEDMFSPQRWGTHEALQRKSVAQQTSYLLQWRMYSNKVATGHMMTPNFFFVPLKACDTVMAGTDNSPKENYGGVRIQRRRPTEDHKWTWLKPNSDAHGDKRKQAAHPSPRRGRFIRISKNWQWMLVVLCLLCHAIFLLAKKGVQRILYSMSFSVFTHGFSLPNFLSIITFAFSSSGFSVPCPFQLFSVISFLPQKQAFLFVCICFL